MNCMDRVVNKETCLQGRPWKKGLQGGAHKGPDTARRHVNTSVGMSILLDPHGNRPGGARISGIRGIRHEPWRIAVDAFRIRYRCEVGPDARLYVSEVGGRRNP